MIRWKIFVFFRIGQNNDTLGDIIIKLRLEGLHEVVTLINGQFHCKCLLHYKWQEYRVER